MNESFSPESVPVGVALFRLVLLDDIDAVCAYLDEIEASRTALISAVLVGADLIQRSGDVDSALQWLQRMSLVAAHDAIVDQ